MSLVKEETSWSVWVGFAVGKTVDFSVSVLTHSGRGAHQMTTMGELWAFPQRSYLAAPLKSRKALQCYGPVAAQTKGHRQPFPSPSTPWGLAYVDFCGIYLYSPSVLLQSSMFSVSFKKNRGCVHSLPPLHLHPFPNPKYSAQSSGC